jgi:hypothetical protein
MNNNARNRTTLSPKQEAAALSLATGATKVEAAGSVDVAVRTIKAWTDSGTPLPLSEP